jgi:hypothetical protein
MIEEECIGWGLVVIYPSGVLYCKQFLGKKCSIPLKFCWGDYILQEAGVLCALLVLYVALFEVNNLILWQICVYIEDSV